VPNNPVVGVQPPAVYPAERTWLGIGRELTAGTAVLPTNTIPMDAKSYSPEDTPHFLPDEAIRGQMAMLYNEILGPADATFSFGGPNFLDVHGFFLDNIFGDTSSYYNGTLTGTTTTTAALLVGATAATVSNAVTPGWTVGSYVQFEPAGSPIAEVVKVGGTSATQVFFAGNPLRFQHGSGGSIYTIGTPTNTFTHVFALLNSSYGYNGILGAQPPTHTLMDVTQIITGTANTLGPANLFGARAYPMACLSAMDFTGNAEQLLDIKVTGNSWPSVVASTVPTNVISSVIPVANWQSTVFIGGTGVASQVFDVGEWSVNLKRTLKVYWTAQGAQTPYVIARGPFSAEGVMDFTVPSDDSPLYYMIENTQPQVQLVLSNGLAGTSLVSITINMQVAAFTKSKISRNQVLVGYNDTYMAVANATNVGGSGGLGPATVTLVNAQPAY
jgi:hypothetical protein